MLSQSFANYELIIVDNASSDSTASIIKKYKDSRITFYENEENVGVNGNHNLCMKYASGKYIQLLSSDDKSLNDFCLNTIFQIISSCHAEPNVIGLTSSLDEKIEALNEDVSINPELFE